jgi:aryl-alcohol dehydrogenase-like predicted oxidoreductase
MTPIAHGTWSAGRFMHFGEVSSEADFILSIQTAFEAGIRTFVTSDVYGKGAADSLLGHALQGIPREQYHLVGLLGHDIYDGIRQGSSGYPRFTHPDLRGPEGYANYLTSATAKMLERLGTDHLDCAMLHNPDHTGYHSPAVWEAMSQLRHDGLASQIGVAPGPANGFTLDLIRCFERFGQDIDWAMIILNPLEPWPGRLCLPAASQQGIKVLTRVIDHGGVLWDDVKPGHSFRDGDHRTYRPQGWVEHGHQKAEAMRPYADRHGLSLIQLAAAWCLGHEAVHSVVPTVIQEVGANARPIADKIKDLAALPLPQPLSAIEIEEIAAIGDNTGCMLVKGASDRHAESTGRPDEWPMEPAIAEVATRWGLTTSW